MVGATFSTPNHPNNFRPLQPPQTTLPHFHPHSVVDPSAFQIFSDGNLIKVYFPFSGCKRYERNINCHAG